MDACERQARRLIRFAYPRRFLVHREDELLGVLLDLAEPGADRLPRRLAWDVLLGGVRFRLRNRPPFLPWLGYRFLDLRLPARWQPWIRDDIMGRLWPARRHLVVTATMLVVIGVLTLLPLPAGVGNPFRLDPVFLLSFAVVGLIVTYLSQDRFRRASLKRHRFDPAVERYRYLPAHQAWRPPPGFVVRPVPRQQVWPALVVPGAATLTGSVAAAAVLLARFPGAAQRIGLTMFVGVALGACLVVPVRRRLGRRLAARSQEPDRPQVRWPRWLVGLGTLTFAWITAAAVASLARNPEAGLAALTPIMITLVVAPAVTAAGLVVRAAERESGQVVTGRELALGVFGNSDVIPPERPVQTPFPPPPTPG